METIIDKDGELKDLTAIKLIVRRLCKFPNPEEWRMDNHRYYLADSDCTNGQINRHITGSLDGIPNYFIDYKANRNCTVDSSDNQHLQQCQLQRRQYQQYGLR